MDGVSSLVSLIGFSAACFECCIKGLVILSKARSYRRDVSGISLIFELELHKLYAWAVEVGLSREPPVLLVAAEYASVVSKVLDHLQSLVSDVDKLQKNHGVQLQETSEQLLILDEGSPTFERLDLETSDDCEHFLKRIFRRRKEPWRALKWVTFDEQKVRGLLGQVKIFIDELQKILDRSRQAKLERTIDMLARNVVMNSANEQELDMIGFGVGGSSTGSNVAATARLKKQGLLLGIMDVQNPPASPTTSCTSHHPKPPQRCNSVYDLMPRYSNSDLAKMRLSAGRLTFMEYSSWENRMLALYNNSPVLLEFKDESGLDHDVMKDRLCKVSFFLRDLDKSFHGLPCLGFVKVYDRYAYVFDLDHGTPSLRTAECMPAFRTLRHLLDEVSTPSLNLRLAFAITILETLLQLHTSGWLHKELRSDNVLFILGSYSQETDFLLASLRVTGYVYARVDDLHEPTEPLMSELQADLYRHPSCLRQPRESFRRAFDAFSVGCILLELGLWCSLATFLQKISGRPPDYGNHFVDLMRVRQEMFFPSAGSTNGERRRTEYTAISQDILQNVEALMGRTYASVVDQFLSAPNFESSVSDSKEPAFPSHKNLLNMEFDCLEKLRSIAEVL